MIGYVDVSCSGAVTIRIAQHGGFNTTGEGEDAVKLLCQAPLLTWILHANMPT
jgi:hypothetical protein